MLFACPYNSNVTLTERDTATFEKEFKGNWDAFNDDGTRIHLLIQMAEKNFWGVTQTIYKEDGSSDKVSLKAHNSPGLGIMNVEKPDSSYSYCRYGLVGKEEFWMDPIAEDFVVKNLPNHNTATQKELFDLVKRNIDNSAMYEARLTFYKVGSSGHTTKQKSW